MSILITIALLVGATFLSEDLACIAAGQLVARGELDWMVGVIGCFAGIFVGDMLLWLTGRGIGRRVLQNRWIAPRLPQARIEQFENWFDRNAILAVFAARFLPGTRLPLYLAAGILTHSGLRFALATLLAAAIWTPAVVIAVALLGDRFVRPFERFVGRGWIALLVAALVCFILFRTMILLTTEIGRARLIARISLLWRWEFWPMILFYPPVALWVAWLSLRHRGFTTITAANPGIPHGGFVGESKFQILKNLESKHVIPGALIAAHNCRGEPCVRPRRSPGKIRANTRFAPTCDCPGIDQRVKQLDEVIEQNRLVFPLILKPDVGQRGAGVKLIHTREEASRYLAATCNTAILVQPYHPGPHEAGIFYYRFPGSLRGRIFSITDKHFSQLFGDGESTIEQLIWRHPRYRMQAATFSRRHADQLARILAKGESFRLAVSGNHCQGTLFRDGSHLITPQLEAKIDEIARSFDGFYFGRFDVRYSDVEAFKRGEDLTIIELNGITSESTNIYDPSRTLLWAYRKLAAQWSILFRIGAANRRLGHAVTGHVELVRQIVRYLRSPRPAPLGD